MRSVGVVGVRQLTEIRGELRAIIRPEGASVNQVPKGGHNQILLNELLAGMGGEGELGSLLLRLVLVFFCSTRHDLGYEQ